MRALFRAALALGCCALPALARADEARDLAGYAASEREFAVAVAAQRSGLPDDARAAYARALALDPRFVEAAVNLARLELDAGELEAAERWLARAEAMGSAYPRVAEVRGLLALARGDVARALEALALARRALPGDAEVGVNLGAALIRAGRLREARALLSELLRARPEASAALYNLAVAADRDGDRDAARFAYERFLALTRSADPARDEVARRLGELAASEGRVHGESLDSEAHITQVWEGASRE